MSVEENLKTENLNLPEAGAVAGNYVASVGHDGLLYISGQISRNADGTPLKGRLGDNMDKDAGYLAAQNCGLHILAVAKAALGDLNKVAKIIKLNGFVAATPEFEAHPAVINGASDLMVTAFGEEIGMHARAAVGMSSLPLGVAVEIDAIIAVKD